MNPDSAFATSREQAATIQSRAAQVGADLADTLAALVADLGGDGRPAGLARSLGLDKVLTSRVVKSCRASDPLAVLHAIPGPDPLRRFVRAAQARGADGQTVAAAEAAIDAFDTLVREEAGNRSEFEVALSAWLPETRADFELRRKQPAFRCMSHLKGLAVDTNFSTVLLHPAADAGRLDVVWLYGLLGLRRLRPGATVKFASRRIGSDGAPRATLTLDEVPVEGFAGLLLPEFCSDPPPRIRVERVGSVIHYTLGDRGFGPRSATDVITAEVNRSEMPAQDTTRSGRKHHLFAEVTTPSKVLVFDALLHRDVDPGAAPTLSIYDTVPDGIADAGDPARDIDRLTHSETVQSLGEGITRFRCADVPRYPALLDRVCERLGWDGDAFRGFRCRVEYPVYGSQVVMSFPAPPAAG